MSQLKRNRRVVVAEAEGTVGVGHLILRAAVPIDKQAHQRKEGAKNKKVEQSSELTSVDRTHQERVNLSNARTIHPASSSNVVLAMRIAETGSGIKEATIVQVAIAAGILVMTVHQTMA